MFLQGSSSLLVARTLTFFNLLKRIRTIYPFNHVPARFAAFCVDVQSFVHLSRLLPWQMKSTFIIVLFLLDLPGNAQFCKEFRVFMVCSEMCECGKSEQNLASYYYLLVVKLVVKRKFLLLRFFSYTHSDENQFYIPHH